MEAHPAHRLLWLSFLPLSLRLSLLLPLSLLVPISVSAPPPLSTPVTGLSLISQVSQPQQAGPGLAVPHKVVIWENFELASGRN